MDISASPLALKEIATGIVHRVSKEIIWKYTQLITYLHLVKKDVVKNHVQISYKTVSSVQIYRKDRHYEFLDLKGIKNISKHRLEPGQKQRTSKNGEFQPKIKSNDTESLTYYLQ